VVVRFLLEPTYIDWSPVAPESMPASAILTDDLGDAFNIDLSITDAGNDLSTITVPLSLE
jgi:hypothetical protein